MKRAARLRLIATGLLLGTGVGAEAAQGEASPALEPLAERTAARDLNAATTTTEKQPLHEAILTALKDRAANYADKVPPQRIAERPGEVAPNPNSQWIPGYWDWDASRREFVWVTGTWRVPPPGKFWVDGFWRHVDDKGWTRVPGFWSERRAAPPSGSGVRASRDWRTLGPPPKRPSEPVGMAPAPDYFYIPGEFVPQGEEVVWKPGFWYRSQPGWEWSPAHWVRQATGWAFREGSWSRNVGRAAPPPANGFRPGGPMLVSTPAGFAPAPNGPPPNTVLTTSTGGLTAQTLSPIGLPSESSGATTSNGGPIEDRETDPAQAKDEAAAAAEQPAQLTGTTSGANAAPVPTPVQYGPQPMYYYPGGGTPWNYSGYGGMQGVRFGISSYVGRLLPF